MGRLNLFTVLRFYRGIKVALGFYSDRSPFHLFHINQWPGFERVFYLYLIGIGYQYNYMSLQEKGQVMNVRRLTGVMQYHLRLFSDGEVRGHFELNYEFFPEGHLRGEDLVEIDATEKKMIRKALGSPILLQSHRPE